jgi:hypothetical protein
MELAAGVLVGYLEGFNTRRAVAPCPLALSKLLGTVNFRKLFSVMVPVVTVTYPLEAPADTVAKRNVVPVRVTAVAGTPLNCTTDDALNPCPNIPTFDPCAPCGTIAQVLLLRNKS